jgi:hypothetical protein
MVIITYLLFKITSSPNTLAMFDEEEISTVESDYPVINTSVTTPPVVTTPPKAQDSATETFKAVSQAMFGH